MTPPLVLRSGMLPFRGKLRAVMGLAALALAIVASGCAGLQVPRIDPSGERIFLPPGPTPQPVVVGPPAFNAPFVAPAQPGRRVGPAPPGVSLLPARITIRTTGPAETTLGATATYRIEVTNPSSAAVENVVVTDQPPAGLTFLNSSPAADSSSSGQQWRVGRIEARATSVIEANYRAAAQGSQEFCATATTSGGLSAKDCATTVVGGEPASEAARLSIEVQAAETAAVGDEIRTVFRIVNQGEQPATGLTLKNRFDAGLKHATLTSPIESELPDIPAGTARRVSVTLRAIEPGKLCQDVEVRGAGGVIATARHCVTATAATSQPSDVSPPVGPAKLTLTNTGPTRSAVGETAEFRIVVTNAGGETLRNLKISTTSDAPVLEVEQATQGWQASAAGAIEWTIATLEPGKSRERVLVCRCKQAISRACNRAIVTAEPNLRVASEACLEILPEGSTAAAGAESTPAGGLTVSVVDQKDPINVGDQTTYKVTVTNNSTTSQRDVTLVVNASPELKIESVEGLISASITERRATFSSIAELRAKESISFSIRAVGARKGSAVVKAEATAGGSREMATGEEKSEVLDR